MIVVVALAVVESGTMPSANAAPPAPAAAASSSSPSASSASAAPFRRYLGTTSASINYRVSVPSAGRYAVQYAVTGTAFFDTYVGARELGYVGGVTGTYTTTSLWLRAGRHVVQVVGPEGTGSARVYLISAH